MYWWDYASVHFVGMFLIGLLVGWAFTAAFAGGAGRLRRPRRFDVLDSHLVELSALLKRQQAVLRRLEEIERAHRPTVNAPISAFRPKLVTAFPSDAA